MSMFQRPGEDSSDSDDEDGKKVQPQGRIGPSVVNGLHALRIDEDVKAGEQATKAVEGKVDSDASSSMDDSEGLFGNMLDLPVGRTGVKPSDCPSGTDDSAHALDPTSTILTIRDFPLPKHLPSSLIMPKRLLSDMLLGTASLGKTAKPPAIATSKVIVTTLAYQDVSGGSRAKRVRLDLEWAGPGTSSTGGSATEVNGIGSNSALGAAKERQREKESRAQSIAAAAVAGKQILPDRVIKALEAKGVDPESVGGMRGPAPPEDPAALARIPDGGIAEDQSTVVPGEAKEQSADPPGAEVKPALSKTPPRRPNSLTYTMETVATSTIDSAENYLATIALHEITTHIPHCSTPMESLGLRIPSIDDDPSRAITPFVPPLYPSVNPKTLPIPYRDLWEELEVLRQEREDSKARAVWKGLDEILIRRSEGTADEANAQASTAIPVAGPVKNGKAGEKANGARALNGTRAEAKFDQRIYDQWVARKNSLAYQKMLPQRESLPVAAFRQELVEAMENNQVLIISGETGSGKSTQLPSFLLESHLEKGLPCKIFCTEPRRISAISLADRVSQELGDRSLSKAGPGEDGLVGYSIRGESRMGRNTRLAFVTNGIALRMLEAGSNGPGAGGSAFDEVTHICIDEVHERSIDTDFLLIIIRTLLLDRKDLKVVLMSATLNAAKISEYFGGAPIFNIPGRTFPVKTQFLEDAIEYSNWFIQPNSPYAIPDARNRNKQLEWAEDGPMADNEDDDDEDKPSDPMKLSATAYRKQTIDTCNLLDPRQIPYDLILRIMEKLCLASEDPSPYSHAVLIFLPGLAEIRKLNDLLNDHERFGMPQDFKIFPLHSSISSEGQASVFETMRDGVRKIVISTNIAETGVTIPDITCVIDSCKEKSMTFDEKRQISRLKETYIARSNAQQRRGRAGRVRDGLAFHLITKARHDTQLAGHPSPEMLRLSLQDLALRIKILKVKLGSSIADALGKALDPPTPLNIARAISSLVEVKALTATEEITPMGRLLSKMPVDVHLGKFLLFGTLFNCLDPCLSICATLNSKNPFVTPFGHEHAVDTVKSAFKVGNSDFLTIVNVFNSWRKLASLPNPMLVRQFCRKNYLSHQTLQQIEELRQQLYSYLVDSGFVQITAQQKEDVNRARFTRSHRGPTFLSIPAHLNVNAEEINILNAALLAGLYPKVLVIDQGGLGGGMRTLGNNQPISMHPSSVNFRMKTSEFGANHVVYFTIMQSKKLYAWETGPVDDLAMFLLCGDSVDLKVWASTATLDRRVKFNIDPRTALSLEILRKELNEAISTRMRGKALTDRQERWFQMGLRVLSRVEVEGEDGERERIGLTL